MTDDIIDRRVERIQALDAPRVLLDAIPLSASGRALVLQSRQVIGDIIDGRDSRLLVVVGPCSVHDRDSAVEYATRLAEVARTFAGELFVVMRVYFEKPRSTTGWKGLINDPDLDGSFRIGRGLRLARGLLRDITELGLPCGTEFLDATFGQYYSDFISWGAIGARTTESQIHRQLASGLSMPVGIKNRTDGDVQVAVDALVATRQPHHFPSLTLEGQPAVFSTLGNPDAHLILRGGSRTGPNYTPEHVKDARQRLARAGLFETLIVDCSHGNSAKDAARQAVVAHSLVRQMADGESAIRGIMLESHLIGGRQELVPGGTLTFGQSITDACLSFDETRQLLEYLAGQIARGSR